MVRLILITQILLCISVNLFADCEGAEYYLPATVIRKDNSIIKGYIPYGYDTKIWNHWQDNRCQNEGCEDVVFYSSLTFNENGNLYIYKELIKVHEDFPFKGHAIPLTQIDTVHISEILKIEVGKYDPDLYSGSVFLIPDEQIELILAKPVAYYRVSGADENDLVDTYLISYNHEIMIDELISIGGTDYRSMIEELNQKKVLIVENIKCSY